MRRGLGRLEAALFAYAQLRGASTVQVGELGAQLRLSPVQARKLLSRLARAGLIARVWRGLYLVPPRLPLGGKWSPDEGLALNTMLAHLGGRYQICGPNAFNRYGFDGQIPTKVYAYNNRLSGERRVGPVALTLIKVADDRLGDTEEVRTAEGRAAAYSSRARALLDAVYDWSRFDSLPRGFAWIRRELAARRVSAEELVTVALRYGDMGTIRRMGALLQGQGAGAALLRRLERALGATTASIPFDPTRPKRGTVDRRWGVVRNEPA